MTIPDRKQIQKRLPLLLAFIILLVGFTVFAEQISTMYIHSAKAPVYAEPNNTSEKIMQLNAGTEIQVLDKKGFWYLINYQGKSGWIFKLMVRDKPPRTIRAINVNQLAELESKARRRPSAYTTTASARGLKAKRERFAGKYKTDYSALERLEAMAVPPETADKFLMDGMNHEKSN